MYVCMYLLCLLLCILWRSWNSLFEKQKNDLATQDIVKLPLKSPAACQFWNQALHKYFSYSYRAYNL